jgi:hypothetical protein
MSDFHRHSKVVCIDATPIPINVTGATLPDFTFPNGFLVKGATYAVIHVGTGSDGQPALRLAGCHVLHKDTPISWHGQRFRLIKTKNRKAHRNSKMAKPSLSHWERGNPARYIVLGTKQTPHRQLSIKAGITLHPESP